MPLQLSYFINEHKTQGMKLDEVVANIGQKEFRCGLKYVALSQMRTNQGLVINCSFSREWFIELSSKKASENKQENIQ